MGMRGHDYLLSVNENSQVELGVYGAVQGKRGGYDNISPKVEEAMHGKNIIDVVIVDLQSVDAFGEYDEELVQI
jgi:FKBP-type peptidyl-prolyl cis-trans isomerase 2